MELGQEDALQAEKTNAKRETETLKMGTAPSNRRGHLQLNKTHGQWQWITLVVWG
jgi:hypothetical protein